MTKQLEGKRALVTGASRGIGRSIAIALAEAGADVAIGYRRDLDAAESAVAAIEAHGKKAYAHSADVRDGPAMHAFVEAARDALGGLDIVVANAGVPTRFEPLQQVDPAYWKRVIDIDLTGVFHTLHAALPILQEQESGVILTISSVASDMSVPFGGPYVAAKAAVNALTKVVARENAAKNVRCNVIAPGLIQTDIADGMFEAHGEVLLKSIPLGRLGTADEVARMAVYLCSEDAAWITGKVFRIDGGQHI